MGVCVICLTRTGKTSKRSFHKFPFKKNPAVAEKWVQWVCAVKKCCWTPCKSTVICSDHFAPSAFDRSTFRVELNIRSIPTIFLPDSNTIPSEVNQLSNRQSPLHEICTERTLKKHCGDDTSIKSRPSTSNDIPDSIAPEIFNTPAKCPPSGAIPESEATPKTSASILVDECRIGRRRSLFHHDHNYENTPMTYRKKNIELKKKLHKARTINKSQRQKIKRLKKQVESLKELVHSGGRNLDIRS